MSYRSGSSHNAKVHATLWSGLQLSKRAEGLGLHRSKQRKVAPSGLQWSSCRCWYESVAFEKKQAKNKQPCAAIKSDESPSIPTLFFKIPLSKKQTDHLKPLSKASEIPRSSLSLLMSFSFPSSKPLFSPFTKI